MFKVKTEYPHKILQRTIVYDASNERYALSIWSGDKEDLKTEEEARELAQVIADFLNAKRDGRSVHIEIAADECKAPCGMNYCDENGCINRKRHNVNVIQPPPEQ